MPRKKRTKPEDGDYGGPPQMLPWGITHDPRMRQIRETTVYKCPQCRRTTYHEGTVREKGCRLCDKP